MTQTIGYRTGRLRDTARKSWDGTEARPLDWTAWYPAEDTPTAALDGAIFDTGPVAVDADLQAGGALPTVLLSHGTGGTADSIGWIGAGLARAGFLAIASNHHGNSGLAPYQVEGFLCWWERAPDLSELLTQLSARGPFASRIDRTRLSAVGFSLGGYTVLSLMGARTSMRQMTRWAKDRMSGPREFPNAADQIPLLMARSAPFRQAWARHGDDFTDPRISRAVAIAPAPPVRGFLSESLAKIARPVALLTGGADTESPNSECADWLMAQNPRFQHASLGPAVGHFTFLGLPTDLGLKTAPDLFEDAPGVRRADVHAQTLARIVAFITL